LSTVVWLAPVSGAAEAVETAAVGVGVEAERFDLADACGRQARDDIGLEVEMRLAGRSGDEELAISFGLLGEARMKAVVDLKNADIDTYIAGAAGMARQ